MPDTIDDVDEHPIIFNDWSITRILVGEKTQTRRIVSPQPPDNADRVEIERDGTLGYFSGDTAAFHDTTTCPYGHPGDVLWVREAFRLPVSYEKVSPSDYVDSELPLTVRFEADGGQPVENSFEGDSWGRKRPSIHMPRELSRLRLRVEDVRVERVKEIDGYDASAEGIQPPRPEVENGTRSIHDVKRRMFREKWNNIHGGGAWERNDWVWVIEFSQIGNT